MLTYWILFLIPASMALFVGQFRQYKLIPWILIGFLFIVIIGFRYEVGGDWFVYIRHFENMHGISLLDALKKDDPGHQFLNWLSYRLDLGVYGTNIIYGIIFMIGLIKFSRQMTYPWLAMVAAVPYLIIVVAMGYSRQGVAIGLFLWGITYLNKGGFKAYVGFIFIAALFHKTAILLLPLGIFLYGKGLTLRILMLIPIAYGGWDLLLADQQEKLWENYVEAQMQSEGAKIRVAMNLFPSLLFFIYRKEWKKNFDDYFFWFWIALASIIFVGLVGFASTAVDRLALYFIPIQLVVFARLPYLARKQVSPSVIKVLIVLMYTLVLYIWLNYATNAFVWIPYKNIIFQGLI